MKYYKATDKQFEPEVFKLNTDSDSNLLFYFDFIKSDLNRRVFFNFMEAYYIGPQTDESLGIAVNGDPHTNFVGVAWFEPGRRLLYGSVRTLGIPY